MASSSSSSNNTLHIRSISLPTCTHPATLRLEEELYSLKTWEASASGMPMAETICSGLVGLERLYNSVNDLLSLPLIQQSLSHSQHEKLVDELLERSMRLLDVCGSTRDAMSQFKEHVRDVRSALRRRKGDLSINTSFIKKMKQDAKKTISGLKQIDNRIGGLVLLDLDEHLSAVIRSMRDVSEVSSSVFECLLSFTSASVSKPKSSKWSIVSKLVNKGALESKVQPQSSIETLDSIIEGIENDLECMFRSLIKTRASLLNIRSY